MNALRELQDDFRRALLGGSEAAAAAAVVEDAIAPERRLQIYRHHVFTTLTDALATTYPVVRRLVDERFFAYAADRFIRRHPPAGPCLHEYGASFSRFLATFSACRHLEYLPDIARLEWALNRAVHAEDGTPIARQRLASIPPERLPQVSLRLDPSVSFVQSPWPVDRVWRANQPDSDPASTVDLDAGGVTLEVRRAGDVVGFRRIDPATHAFRTGLAGRRPLGEAAARALTVDPSYDLAGALHALLEEQMIVRLRVKSR
jgi:hypothetical protein